MSSSHMTLYELNSLVSEVISTSLPDEYWVEAEVSELRERSGHCYIELVQKDEGTNTPIAKASAKCWRNSWSQVQAKFISVTRQNPRSGMKMLLRVSAQFHENYGFSWIISDIDPSFTLGDMARRRQEIIQKLKEEGVFDLNKELPMPLFAKRIAVISSETAAGYGDFHNQLENNAFGFKFTTVLFPAIMQGEKVEQSIIEALNAINFERDNFDCVVIIRGGGASSDLSGFDTLMLAENVANFPLPIITGIGHERDESILDMVSHTRVKTPTAAAAFLIDNLSNVLARIENCSESIVNSVKMRMQVESLRIENISKRIPTLFSIVKSNKLSVLDGLLRRLTISVREKVDSSIRGLDVIKTAIPHIVTNKLMTQQHHLEILSSRITALDPIQTLKRGYSITLYNGKAIHDPSSLKKGDKIVTQVEKGKITSRVEE